MENPNHKWRFIAGKIIYFYGPSTNHGYVSHNQRVNPWLQPRLKASSTPAGWDRWKKPWDSPENVGISGGVS